jgi:hypothetical protein
MRRATLGGTMRRAREGPRKRDHNGGGAHSEEPWDVHCPTTTRSLQDGRPGRDQRGQGNSAGARKSAEVLECNLSTSEKTA